MRLTAPAVLVISCLSTTAEAWFASVPAAGIVRSEAFQKDRHTLFSSRVRPEHGGGTRTATAMSAGTAGADVVDGDTVVVVGASGGVGRLVALSLAATGKYKVRGLVRNIDKAKEALGDEAGSGVELQRGDILDEESLRPAMKDAACVVACTGTTAFPSARWGRGNTPDAVDNLAVGKMLRAAADTSNHSSGGKLKRFVLLSSVGVERADTFPFVILNAFGVLDAKAKGEDAVRTAAEEGGFSYSIVRPGQIKGEPFVSYPAKGGSLAAEVSSEAGGKGSSKRMVSLRQGDVEAGDVNPSSVAAAFTQAVGQPGAAGKSFTVINANGEHPTQDDWDRLFADL